jgi:hypothetical protein
MTKALTTDKPMTFGPYVAYPGADVRSGWWRIEIPQRLAMEEAREPWEVVGRRLDLTDWEVEELRALLGVTACGNSGRDE